MSVIHGYAALVEDSTREVISDPLPGTLQPAPAGWQFTPDDDDTIVTYPFRRRGNYLINIGFWTDDTGHCLVYVPVQRRPIKVRAGGRITVDLNGTDT